MTLALAVITQCLVVCVWLSPVLSLEDAICGGVHCYDDSAYCCSDNIGNQSCCSKALFQEAWFWSVLVIGLVLIGAVLFCTCRMLYRYHNAGQYTKLRRQQQPDGYGTIPHAAVRVHMPPPTATVCDSGSSYNQLPSYADAAAMDRPPPAYSESDNG